jgi:hypothetical protein
VTVTIILVVLIVGFLVVTVFSVAAMLVMRRREKELEISKEVVRNVDEIDTALDSALTEINKLGALIQTEIDEKYKSTLFLYKLVEDKQKEIAESSDGEVISEMMAQYIETHGEKLRSMAGAIVLPEDLQQNLAEDEEDDASEDKDETLPQKEPKFTNPKHKQIWEKRESGQAVSDIAKELDMGQGEVKLILDLIDMAT